MAMKLTYDNPSYPKGAELELPNIGLVKNGEAVEVTKETADSFKATTDQTVSEFFKDNESVKVEGTPTAAPKQETAEEDEGSGK